MLELYKQAHVPHTAIDPSNNMPYETTCFSADKFSELIVLECAQAIQKERVNFKPTEWDEGSDWGLKRASDVVKEHFGVK